MKLAPVLHHIKKTSTPECENFMENIFYTTFALHLLVMELEFSSKN